jgi:hypothetical protein
LEVIRAADVRKGDRIVVYTNRRRPGLSSISGTTDENVCVSVPTVVRWGTGFFSADLTLSGTRLLHIERDGASQVLWAQPAGTQIWGISSWDGRRLATLKPRMNTNVWIVENP